MYVTFPVSQRDLLHPPGSDQYSYDALELARLFSAISLERTLHTDCDPAHLVLLIVLASAAEPEVGWRCHRDCVDRAAVEVIDVHRCTTHHTPTLS